MSAQQAGQRVSEESANASSTSAASAAAEEAAVDFLFANIPMPGNSAYRNACPQEPLSVKEVTTRQCDPRLLSTRVKRWADTETPPNCVAMKKHAI